MRDAPPPHVTQHWRVTEPAATGRSDGVRTGITDAMSPPSAAVAQG